MAAPPSLTWLHLSDIHFHPRTGWRDAHAQDTLLEFLGETFAEEAHLRPDFVFCTGDIAFGETRGASMSEQYESAAGFFGKVLAMCGDGSALPKERLFVVPGNHDVDRSLINADAQAMLQQKTAESALYVAEINHRFADCTREFKDAAQRLDAYAAFVKSWLPHQHDAAGRVWYAKTMAVNGLQIGIAGLNSAWSSGGEEDDRKLWLAAEWQFNHARVQLQVADLRIALMHHPVDNLNQSERDLATRRLASDFDFFLHGHSHNAWVTPGSTSSVTTVAAGAVGAGSGDEFGVNIVRKELASGTVEVHLFRYDKTGWVIGPVPKHARKGVWRVDLAPILPSVNQEVVAVSGLATAQTVQVSAAAPEEHAVMRPVPTPIVAGGPAPAAAARVWQPGQEFRDALACGGEGPLMVVLPKGSYWQGAARGEVGAQANEGPQRYVTLDYHLAVAKLPVTIQEWAQCVGAGGCKSNQRPEENDWIRGRHPVTNVKWSDAIEFLAWLNGNIVGRSHHYRLLSEMEWEYAARGEQAGQQASSPFACLKKADGSFSSGAGIHTSQANYNGEAEYGDSGSKTGTNRNKLVEAGSLKGENRFGLFDMHGNVLEFVADCYYENYDDPAVPTTTNPKDGGAAHGDMDDWRVWRGGCWIHPPAGLRSAVRTKVKPDARILLAGFRIACTLI